MPTKKTSLAKTSLATAENVTLLKSIMIWNNINLDSRFTAEKLLDLLNRRPTRDEIIVHFIKTDPYKNLQDLVDIFYTKEEAPNTPREDYYLEIYNASCRWLEKWIKEDTQHVYSQDRTHQNLHFVFEKTIKNKHSFLKKLQTFCGKLLEMNNEHADKVIIDIVEYFGKKRELSDYAGLPEFSFIAPTPLVKKKEYDNPFKLVVTYNTEKRKLYYDKKKKIVMIDLINKPSEKKI